MGKYIIDVKDGETLYKAVIAPDGEPYITPAMGNVYTEPDTDEAYQRGYETAKHECEQCRKVRADAEQELAEKAYQRGLNDAWEAAKKICLEEDDGGIPASAINDIFNVRNYRYAVKDYSASECIEKIRQYEQKQEKKDGVWIASETWIVSEANEPSVDTTLICSKCGYAIKIKPHETPALNFCPKCGDCKKPKEEKS